MYCSDLWTHGQFAGFRHWLILCRYDDEGIIILPITVNDNVLHIPVYQMLSQALSLVKDLMRNQVLNQVMYKVMHQVMHQVMCYQVAKYWLIRVQTVLIRQLPCFGIFIWPINFQFELVPRSHAPSNPTDDIDRYDWPILDQFTQYALMKYDELNSTRIIARGNLLNNYPGDTSTDTQ